MGAAEAFHLVKSNSAVLLSSLFNEASLMRALLVDLSPCLTRYDLIASRRSVGQSLES